MAEPTLQAVLNLKNIALQMENLSPEMIDAVEALYTDMFGDDFRCNQPLPYRRQPSGFTASFTDAYDARMFIGQLQKAVAFADINQAKQQVAGVITQYLEQQGLQ